jgi:hypothetical protein
MVLRNISLRDKLDSFEEVNQNLQYENNTKQNVITNNKPNFGQSSGGIIGLPSNNAFSSGIVGLPLNNAVNKPSGGIFGLPSNNAFNRPLGGIFGQPSPSSLVNSQFGQNVFDPTRCVNEQIFLHSRHICHVKITSSFVILNIIDLTTNNLYTDEIPVSHFEHITTAEFSNALYNKDKLVIKPETSNSIVTSTQRHFGQRIVQFYNPYVEHEYQENKLRFECNGNNFKYVIVIKQNTNETQKSHTYWKFMKSMTNVV